LDESVEQSVAQASFDADGDGVERATVEDSERFKSNYLSAAMRTEQQPVQVLVDFIDVSIATGEPPSIIELKGNSREMYNNRLHDKDVECIVMALEASSHSLITTLVLPWNRLTDVGCMCIVEYLKGENSISRLDLSYNDIGEEGGKAVAGLLKSNKTLAHLALNGNKVGDKGGLMMAQALCENTTLRTAELSNMELGHQTLGMMGIALSKNQSLLVLNIDRPCLFSCQEEAIEHLGMGLRVNTSLRSLSLKNAQVHDRGCFLLCDNLVLNYSLTELDLSSNKLTEDCGPSLAHLLERNEHISKLYLANNELHDRGCTALSQSLSNNASITDLDVAYNGIDNDGLLQLASAVHTHGLLTRLRAWGNLIKPQSTAALAYACQQLKGLKSCDILVQLIDEVPNAVRKVTPDTFYQPGMA
jgi:hypothetical protein